ncbi:hypothetical protein [Chitinimonas sp. BJB300]|uniref:hypothetical protein n=1 Tax=Chitinimonas sp. BJB300 TaxID=1559339 RepID=UPI000C0FDC70|nr:hypothetical protein [Chitinimonas sp. BJB300]PHV09787.1 hypothetical protein CSQ89_19755 [Chitinimonas sp. BJB300]TSJ83901.1 hypothetical protein FG002_020460 [Chitinimonas sp. BJB300]
MRISRASEDPGLDAPPPFDTGYFGHCAESGPPDWWTDRDECEPLDGEADWVRCDDGFELWHDWLLDLFTNE